MPLKQYKSSARILDTNSELECSDNDDAMSMVSLPLNCCSEAPSLDLNDNTDATKLLTPPKTVQRKKKRKADEKDDEKAVSRALTYILSIISAEELKKLTSKQEPKTVSLNLSSDKPWDTFKAQVLIKIEHALNPTIIKFEDYNIKYYISCILPKPGLELNSEALYQDLIQRSHDIKGKTPTINITIRQSANHSEGAHVKENVEPTVAKGNKRARRDPETLPGNVAKNNNLQLLQQEWKCKKRQDSCVGVYCFPDPETGEHLLLNHERLDCWASAMLAGKECVTLHKPLNHKLFDAKNAISPILQRCQEALNQKNIQPAALVFNFNIGNDLLEFFHPPGGALPPAPAPVAPPVPLVPAPALVPAPTPSINISIPADCPFLLPPSHLPGLEMPLGTFCTSYELDNNILNRLDDNCYKKSSSLRFVTIQELKDMGFHLGEIAALWVAVDTWSLQG